MPSDPSGGEALAGQLELCLLRDQPRPHSQPGSLKPERQEATGRAQQAQHAGGGRQATRRLPELFLQSVLYNLGNLGGVGDNLFLNTIGEVQLGPLAVQKEAQQRAQQAVVPMGCLEWGAMRGCALLRSYREVRRTQCQPPPAHGTVWPFLGRRWGMPTHQPPAVPQGNTGAIL